jgi:hypothetical protein
LADQPQVTVEEWQRRFGHYLHSTERFVRNQGTSIAYFVTHFDSFKDGPILETDRLGAGEDFSARRRRRNKEALNAVFGPEPQTPPPSSDDVIDVTPEVGIAQNESQKLLVAFRSPLKYLAR